MGGKNQPNKELGVKKSPPVKEGRLFGEKKKLKENPTGDLPSN